MKLLLALFACALALPAQLSYPPQMPGAHEHVYRTVDGVNLSLYVFEPQGHAVTDRSPAIIFFFGGGWNNGSPAQFLEQSKYLASRGMVAIAADYRVASRQGVKAYQCIEDAKAAMRWVRAHAGELGIDPNRIAAGGGSAGGHLAAATATLPLYDDPAGAKSVSVIPNALVLFNPVTMLAPAEVNGKSHEPTPMQDRFGAPPESVSPYHNIGSNPPPTILFHGKADSTVAYATAEMFCEKMVASGGRCELVGYDRKNHGFFNYGRDGNVAYVDTVRRMDRFFVDLGWLTGEPTL